MILYPPHIPLNRVSELQPVQGVVTAIEGATRGADGLWRSFVGAFTYTVAFNFGDQTVVMDALTNPFNIFPTGYPMICHTPGLPVLGTRLDEFYYLQFVEHRDEEDCE